MARAQSNTGRDWQVLLIGGSSGTGKTVASARVAKRLGIAWTQVDDIRLALQRGTSPRRHPALHAFLAVPQIWQQPPENPRDRLIAIGEALPPSLAIIVDRHRPTKLPRVLEGDGILPELAAAEVAKGQVRAVFLIGEDGALLLANARARGRGIESADEQEERAQARMHLLYGQWLKQEASRVGLPVVPSRPWETLADRIITAM